MIQIKQILSKLDYKTLIIVVLAVILLITRMCSSPPTPPNTTTVKLDGKKYELVSHKIDTVYVPTVTIKYLPGKTIPQQHLKPTTPPANINKDSIVKDYYSTTVYKDTVKLKNNQGYVSVTDTVSKNKIVGRVWNAHINSTIIHDNSVIKDLPVTQVYIGGLMGFDKNSLINFVGPSLLLKTKQDHIYSLGVGYSSNKVIAVQGGIYWKIHL